MKTQVINYLLLLIALMTGFFVSVAFKPQQTGRSILTMAVSFIHTEPGIIITDENGKQEVVELKKRGLHGISKFATLQEYSLEENKKIKEIISKGYKLTHVRGGDVYSNYIFEKE